MKATSAGVSLMMTMEKRLYIDVIKLHITVDVHYHLPYWPTQSNLDFRNYRRNTNSTLF